MFPQQTASVKWSRWPKLLEQSCSFLNNVKAQRAWQQVSTVSKSQQELFRERLSSLQGYLDILCVSSVDTKPELDWSVSIISGSNFFFLFLSSSLFPLMFPVSALLPLSNPSSPLH